jgi:hypothetical protein
MAVPAHLGDFLVIRKRQGVLNVVRRVAIDANRDILILLIDQGAAMNALRIGLVYRLMASFASLGGNQSAFDSVGNVGDLVGPVAVIAYWSVQVPMAQNGMVDAVQRLRVIVEMASPATLRRGDDVIPSAPEAFLGVLLRGIPVVAVRTSEFAVRGGLQQGDVDLQGHFVAIPELHGEMVLMTALAILLFIGKDLTAGCGGYVMGVVAVCADGGFAGFFPLQQGGMEGFCLEIFGRMALSTDGGRTHPVLGFALVFP